MIDFVKRGAAVFSIVALIMFAFVVGTAVTSTTAQDAIFPVVTPQPVVAQPVLDSERVYSTIYYNVSPSVVSINVVARRSSQATIPSSFSTGTGFVIDTNGHIVTNAHVVEGATRIEVNFFDGSIYRADIVGIDLDSDLAVIQVERSAAELFPVPLGDSSALFIGQEVVAIGSPFNQPWTMTTGIVSALGRTIDGLGNFSIGSVIQTDAAINPGNSGGPLLNLNGEVVGVNSQILSGTRSNSGIGFAVPSNLVERVIAEIMATGRVNYSYLGISGNDVSLYIIEALNLPNYARGVVIGDVSPNTPAARAGLRAAAGMMNIDDVPVPSRVDIIVAIDGTTITGMADLIGYLAAETSPGDTVTMSVIRNGTEQLELPVTLEARPGA